MSEPIRLLLADDQALVRGALSALLGLERDLEVVAEVDRGDRVLDAIRSNPVDVALLDGTNPLTDREQEALRLAVDGRPIADIARALSLSTGTVRNHLSNAAVKTGAASSVQAAVLARDRGWL
jgi:two-component system response regulator DesR